MYNILLQEETLDLLIRLLTATLFGALLGLERDIHGGAAGLRTHLLVSVGAAVFMILSINVARFGSASHPDFARVTDPGRIAAQIVTGIGFLGAGAIIKEGFSVRGLTTAACLWVAAAIGMTCGAGFYLLAIITTLVSLFSLTILAYFERIYQRNIYKNLTVILPLGEDIGRLVSFMKKQKANIVLFDFKKDYLKKITTVKVKLRFSHKGDVSMLTRKMVERLENSNLSIQSIKWSHT